MKRNIIKTGVALVFLTGALTAQAQVQLPDLNKQKVDLGFGVQHSELLSTASSMTITAEQLQQTSAVSLSEALYGKLLGLTAINNGGFVGDEGAGATFNIRGIQTLSDNNILILVDGYERPIDRLTVEEVESVTVLKDAAAVALLGHKGVNGALLVKTKRGVEGKTNIKVGYSHKFTFDPEFAQMLDGYDYASALNKARQNDGLSPAYTEQELNLIKNGTDPHFYPNVDWKNETFKNRGSEDQAHLSVTGGNEKIKYYTMMNYTQNMGLLKNTQQQDYSSQLKFSKANIRGNVDFSLSPSTKISANVLGIFMETSQPNDVDANGATWYVYRTPMSAFPLYTSSGYWGGNEIYGDGNVAAKIQDSGFLKTHQRQLWADVTLEQNLDFWVKGLSFRVSVGYDNSSITKEARSKGHQYAYEYYTGEIGDKYNVNEVVMGNKENSLTFSHWVSNQWRKGKTSVGLYYQNSFLGNDHFSAAAIYDSSSEVNDEQGNTFYRANWTGMAHYNLDNKYLVDLTLAANGSNRSYPAKWAFSPTLALGYIFANNADAKLLNMGKVRASAGIQHSDYSPGIGIWLENWNSSNGDFFYGEGNSSNNGMFINSFPITSFTQETATKLNIGADLRLFKALDFNVDLFYQRRSHIMVDAQEKTSWVVGIQSAYEDVGRVTSYGMELGARYAKKLTNKLYLNAGAFFSLTHNEISNVIENPVYANLSRIGHGVDEAWGLEAIGFFKDQDEINNSPRQEFSSVRPGDVKYKDQNGDDVINEFDRIALGKGTSVPSVNYSFNLGMEYQGFGFNCTFQGASNQMKSLIGVDGAWNVLANNNNLSKDYYDHSWDVAGSQALYPRLSSQTVQNNVQNSTIWYKNINFLKLRNCEVYYKLPATWLQQAHIAGAKVFVQGENLLSFDNVKAMDAEVLSTRYPLLKSVNVGLSVTF